MIDKDKFKLAFLEEARDIVVELESCLLALGESPGDNELVGRTFRALHTIKGSGSMFGFDELAAFTHNLENAFDEVRNGRLQVTAELINLSLAALDQIKTMLEQATGGVAPSAAVVTEILAELQQLTGHDKSRNKDKDKDNSNDNDKIKDKPASDAAAAEQSASELTPTDLPPASQATVRDWQIRFCPGPDLLRTGTDPLLLLRELRQLGSLRVEASAAALPPLVGLDPERCYISWDMVLTTVVERDTISDVFIFVADSCDLIIEPVALSAPKEAVPRDAAPSESATEAPDSGLRAGLPAADQPERTPGQQPPATTPKYPPWGRRTADTPDNASSIRVPAAKLDQFVNLVGELVTVQARLVEIAARREDAEVAAVSEEIERLTTALRESSISVRMLPIRATFERFRRLVHDLARDLHKEVDLTLEGADTELDKSVLDQLNDPLMHLIRNSMDHGIESREKRLAAGKRPGAELRLSARHEGASVLISVADDGGGIDAAAVRERAVEKGLVTQDAQLTEPQIFSLILAPGFSTAREVTDVSGRGVGMDVVRRKVDALRGAIEIASKPGMGTTVSLRLPLTLAIIDGLLVRVGQAYFVLPLASTLECIELTRQDIENANGKHVANVRGEIMPYIRLKEYFKMPMEQLEREQIMIAETEDGRYGFVVDQVLGDHQTVIKNLGRFYRHVDLVSGATILGNGTVALILDAQRLVKEALNTMALNARPLGARTSRRNFRSNDRSEVRNQVRPNPPGDLPTAAGSAPRLPPPASEEVAAVAVGPERAAAQNPGARLNSADGTVGAGDKG